MITNREIAQGCRCQLLTGSYEGASKSCSCQNPSACKLSKSLRATLKSHPKILAAIKRNQKEYEALEAGV